LLPLLRGAATFDGVVDDLVLMLMKDMTMPAPGVDASMHIGGAVCCPPRNTAGRVPTTSPCDASKEKGPCGPLM
jgi:hypothetical protein